MPATRVASGLAPTRTALAVRSVRIAWGSAVALCVTGALVLVVGWGLGVDPVTRLAPRGATMKPNTAFAFLLAGASLALGLSSPTRARAAGATVAALLVSFVGAATLLEYALGASFGIDDVIVSGAGRMSALTALAFTVAGASLVLLDRGRFSDAGAILVFLLGLFVVASYAYGASGIAVSLTVALPTALLFVIFAIGLACARPQRGFAAQFWSEGASGTFARGILPPAVLVPLVVGWARAEAQRRGLIGSEVGTSLFATVTVLLLLGVGAVAVSRAHAIEVESKRRADELARATERVAEAERATVRGSWEWDVRSDRAVWSENMYRIFGLDPGTFVNSNENFLALVHPEDRERMGRAIADALASPGRFLQEYRVRRPDGVTRYFRGEGNVLVGPDESPRLVVGFVQDVTESRALAEAEQRNREQSRELDLSERISSFKSEFMRTAAHELRTPLVPIRTQTFLLRGARGAGLSPAQASSVEILERNVERLSGLVEDIVNATAAQSGKLGLDAKPADLHAEVRGAVERVAPLASARRVGLRVECAKEGTIVADASKIAQVVEILVENAVKFSRADDVVRVAALGTAEGYRVTVADSGVGLDPDAISRLFKPFAQVHDTAERTDAGSGLGLYLARSLVELHGGTIEASSAGIGQGATFAFTIPRTLAVPAGAG